MNHQKKFRLTLSTEDGEVLDQYWVAMGLTIPINSEGLIVDDKGTHFIYDFTCAGDQKCFMFDLVGELSNPDLHKE